MLPVRNQRPKGMTLEAENLEFEIEFFQGVVSRDPQCIEALQVLGDAYTRTGQWEKGLKIDKRLARLCPGNPIVFYNLSCSYSLMNRPDEAFGALERAVQLGYNDAHWLNEDPDLRNIRGDSRFQRICAQIGQP